MKYLQVGKWIYARLTAPDILWYEDKDGNKLHLIEDGVEVPFSTKDGTTPEDAAYQISQFPSTLTTSYLQLILEEDVAACPHPEEYVLPTFGWIDGVEGQECKQCGGIQTKNVDEPWPDQWDSGHSRQVMEGHSGWSEDLALAMANDGYPLGDAILIVANLCGRCLNVMLDHYGTGDGYPIDSEEYEKSNTECDFCEEVRGEVR